MSETTESSGQRLERLYRSYGSIIYSRCRQLLRDDALAEDATQEVFLKVLRHIDDCPDDAAVLTWIYRISTNHCLTLIRNRGRHAEPSSDLSALAGEPPEAQWCDRYVAAQLFERAPAKLRATAELYFVDGLHQQEIALTLGISRRTVLNRLNDFVKRSVKFVGRSAEEHQPT